MVVNCLFLKHKFCRSCGALRNHAMCKTHAGRPRRGLGNGKTCQLMVPSLKFICQCNLRQTHSEEQKESLCLSAHFSFKSEIRFIV